MFTKTIKGVPIPSIGLGTFELVGEAGTAAIRAAIEHGYRHIDTAIRYGNEREVGDAIRACGVDRNELFVTTKIWFADLAPEMVHQRVSESLERLQLDHVDLLLVHWPSAEVPVGETLAAFAEERAAGHTRNIGVSNFPTKLLDESINVHKADLLTNQVEYHPFLAQRQVLPQVCEAGMLLTAYLPLARGDVFRSEVLRDIGRKHGKSAGQVALRWLVQQDGVGAIPRSSKIEHIKANLDVFDFELDDQEMQQVFALDRQDRQVDFDWSPQWDQA